MLNDIHSFYVVSRSFHFISTNLIKIFASDGKCSKRSTNFRTNRVSAMHRSRTSPEFHSKYTGAQTFDKTNLFHINFMFQIFFSSKNEFFLCFFCDFIQYMIYLIKEFSRRNKIQNEMCSFFLSETCSLMVKRQSDMSYTSFHLVSNFHLCYVHSIKILFFFSEISLFE